MSKLGKRVASSAGLHTVLVQTDPSSIDVILIKPAPCQAAFRLLPLRNSGTLAPASRRGLLLPQQSPALPL